MARHRIRGKSKLLEWRREQKRGAIMRPSTFEAIEKGAKKKYGKERAKRIAGAAYWRTAEAKFREEKDKK